LREVIDVATSPRLLLDLACVNFISSVGIGVLVHIYKVASGRTGRVVLTGLQPAVSEALKAVKMLTIFKAFPDRQAGLADLRRDG
jgi:anti-anti-sigma factor